MGISSLILFIPTTSIILCLYNTSLSPYWCTYCFTFLAIDNDVSHYIPVGLYQEPSSENIENLYNLKKNSLPKHLRQGYITCASSQRKFECVDTLEWRLRRKSNQNWTPRVGFLNYHLHTILSPRMCDSHKNKRLFYNVKNWY